MGALVTKLVLLLAAVGPSFSACADRAGVEFTLAGMEQAVLAGDKAAYLLHVSRADPVFLKEQENWAADLEKHRPSAFDLRIHEPDPAAAVDADEGETQTPIFDAEIGLARFEMEMSWTMPGLGRDGADLERSVSFPVVFRRADDGRWVFEGEDWRVKESRGRPAHQPDEGKPPTSDAPSRVRYYPGFEEVAERIISVMPRIRTHVDAAFENPLTHTQEVKIYPTMRHLQASIYLSYVDGLSGWNEPGESIKLLASPRAKKSELRALLAHEYGHVATFELGPHATDIAWWILEGVSEQCAEAFVRNARDAAPGADAVEAVERWARSGRLAPWDRITDFRATPPEFSAHVYKQGQHMLRYISARFGLTARNAWLRAMARGRSLDEATREALGLPFADLDRDWRATLPPEDEPRAEDEQGPPANLPQ